MAKNSMNVIVPYWDLQTWMFDDESRGLVKELFVSGIPEIIDAWVAGIPNARLGFRCIFSASKFPGFTLHLKHVRGDSGGNWYRCEQLGAEGWLCPALFKYFDKAPKNIYAMAEEMKHAC